MRTIWKFPLKIGENLIQMPEGARPLTVQVQEGDVCLWADVLVDAPPEPRIFTLYGTGHPLPTIEYIQYIGTVQLEEWGLVFHVYEKLNSV